jgi:hypothetical protein
MSKKAAGCVWHVRERPSTYSSFWQFRSTASFHFPEPAANFLTNAAVDPQAKIPEYKVCAVGLEAVVPREAMATEVLATGA